MPLRLTQLYQRLQLQDREHQVEESEELWSGSGPEHWRASGHNSNSTPDVAIEATTVFGKVTISNTALTSVGQIFNSLATNVACQIVATKEKLGLQALNSAQANELCQSGILDGEQWLVRPSQELQLYRDDRLAVSGSLTFSIPGLTAYPLLRSSSAIRSLAALVAIAGLLGPVERAVDSIVDGVLNVMAGGLFGLGRDFHATRLRRTLLSIHAGHRANTTSQTFEVFVLGCLTQLPLEVQRWCAATVACVKETGIDNAQLRSITEWAFSLEPRTLVLKDRVEVLATAVVSTCLSSCRIAVVDCDKRSCRSFNDQNQTPHGFAVYHGGSGQDAIRILHEKNWLQPYIAPPSTLISNPHATLKLCCSALKAFAYCSIYLQNAGITDSVADTIIECLKKDAVTFFAREVIVVADEQPEVSYTSLHNTCFYYQYGMPKSTGYDWESWLGMAVPDPHKLIDGKPTDSVQLSNYWYEGYTAQCLNAEPSIRSMHKVQMDSQQSQTHRPENSPISRAVSEVAGLVYALALTCVHIYGKVDYELSATLGGGLCDTYSAITQVTNPDHRRVRRSVCLGVLSSLWLGLPEIWICEWPQTSLGVSNSHGSVMSAIVADTETLEQATTKFVIAKEVPDLMQGELPVVACSATPHSTVNGRGHFVEDTPISSMPHDSCIDVHCFTVTGGKPPPLKSTRLHNSVAVVPVVGYIACGLHWFEYVDLDDAFAVMADSYQNRVLCVGPAPDCDKALNVAASEACWLTAENILRRDPSGKGFTCAQPYYNDDKVVVSALGSGLKQSFLCGVFKESTRMLRYAHRCCVEHTEGDVVIT